MFFKKWYGNNREMKNQKKRAYNFYHSGNFVVCACASELRNQDGGLNDTFQRRATAFS
jgi:hypothetical protein